MAKAATYRNLRYKEGVVTKQSKEEMAMSLAPTHVARKMEVALRQHGEWIKVKPDVVLHTTDLSQIANVFAYGFHTMGWKARFPVHELLTWRRPMDWWQALRERWFPIWWLERRPVRYESFKLEQAWDVIIPGPDARYRVDVPQSVNPRPSNKLGYCAICDSGVPVFSEPGMNGQLVLNPEARIADA